MENLWLVPAAGPEATDHVGRSLTGAIAPEVLSQHRVDHEFAWGCRGSKSGDFDRMGAGDLCLFYTSDAPGETRYNWAAHIVDKKRDGQLASDIWNNEEFECVFFLDSPRQISITPAQLGSAFSPYRPNYCMTFPRGLMRVSPEVVRQIRDNFQSLDAWLASVGQADSESRIAETRSTINRSTFGSNAVDHAWHAITGANLKVERRFLSRFVTALLAKPFVILTGNSGTGKTKLAQLFAQWLTRDTEDYVVVPVGADWTDNRNVLGFVNHLRQEEGRPIYQGTPVLDLVLRAEAEPNHPFFLVLDEMNLSQVERYFADFLSAMESGERVPIHGELEALRTAGGSVVRGALLIPDNLFVVGTVNVDETTYMFSPKVLDRANVIEFRISDAEAREFIDSGATEIGAVVPSKSGVGESFVELMRKARHEPVRAGPSTPVQVDLFKEALGDLLSIMRHGRQEFGYRTIADVIRYLHLDYELSAEPKNWSWTQCLDVQVLQKILPKLHGSKKRVGPVLAALATYCEAGDLDESLSFAREEKSPDSYSAIEPQRTGDPRFPLSHEKLCEMLLTVRKEQFVSFIQ